MGTAPTRITIRPLQESDHSQIVTLFEDFQRHLVCLDPLDRLRCNSGYGRSQLNKTLRKTSKQGAFFVAVHKGLVVGFVAGRVLQPSKDYLRDHKSSVMGDTIELFVSEAMRGHGLGKKLMKAIESFFRKEGCDSSLLLVFAPNTQARNFYNQLGYIERDIELIKKL